MFAIMQRIFKKQNNRVKQVQWHLRKSEHAQVLYTEEIYTTVLVNVSPKEVLLILGYISNRTAREVSNIFKLLELVNLYLRLD
jgi:hypothetical protein